MSQSRTDRAPVGVSTAIDFSQDTLGEVLGAALGMGLSRAEAGKMSRARLEAWIQAQHSAACRREARAAAIGGPVAALAMWLFLVVAEVAL